MLLTAYARAMLLAALAACAPVALSACAQSADGVAASLSSTTGGNPQATVYASQLLAGIPLPKGARSGPIPDGLAAFRPWTPVSGSVELSRFLAVRESRDQVRRYLLTHLPAKSRLVGVERPDQAGPVYIYYQYQNMPAGLDYNIVALALIPEADSETALGAFAKVAWSPARTAVEYLRASDMKTMTIAATVNGAKPIRITRTFHSPRPIATVIRLLNSFPAMPNLAYSCPLPIATYAIVLSSRIRSVPDVTISVYGCQGVQIQVEGFPQPVLWDQHNALSAAAGRLLGIKAAQH